MSIQNQVEHVPRRLDEEPVVFKGLTASEIIVIVIAAAVVWLPLCLLVFGMLGFFVAGFGMSVVAIVATVMLAPKYVAKWKENRPDGYLQHTVALWLDAKGLRKCRFIVREGQWDIGRTD